MRPTVRQLWILVALMLIWGLNWPVMKVAISGLPDAPLNFPPLTFRALSMVLGLPVLAAALLWLKVPFAVPRQHWSELLRLALLTMMVWHVIVIVSMQPLPVPLLTSAVWMTALTAGLMVVLSATW